MDFIQEYFLNPLMSNGWFNPVNSIVYGVILIAGIWLVFNLLKKLKITINNKLFIALIPFIAFAGVTRTLRDYIYFSSSSQEGFLSSFSSNIMIMQENAYNFILLKTGNPLFSFVDSYVIAWFPTPGSYFITFVIALTSLLVSIAIQKYFKVEYWKTLFVIGCVFFSLNASMLPFSSVTPLLYIGSVSLAWLGLFFLIYYLTHKKYPTLKNKIAVYLREIFTKLNSTILASHMFDATATFFAIAVFSTVGGHGYTEQHFLSRSLMPFLGPQIMFLLKLVVVIPVLYFIDKHIEDNEFGNFLKLAVFIMGLAPASRNLARLIVGV